MKRPVLKYALGALSMVAFTASLLSVPASAQPVMDANCDLGAELKLPVVRWHDEEQPSSGYIVGIHGLTFYASAYDDLARGLAAKGYNFYAADMRGFGRWRDESKKFSGDDKIHFSDSEADIVSLCKALRVKHPGQKVYVLGESLGANLAFWLASNRPDLVDGVIVSAPCIAPAVHPTLRWATDFVAEMSHPNKALNLKPYVAPYLSNDRAVTEGCLNDEKIVHSMRPAELFKADKTNKQALANLGSIPEQMPVLVFAGAQDKVMHSSAIPKVLPKIGSKKVAVHILPDRGHLLLEHQATDPEIATILSDWLSAQVAASPVIAQATTPAGNQRLAQLEPEPQPEPQRQRQQPLQLLELSDASGVR